jgi:hypothetical protein
MNYNKKVAEIVITDFLKWLNENHYMILAPVNKTIITDYLGCDKFIDSTSKKSDSDTKLYSWDEIIELLYKKLGHHNVRELNMGEIITDNDIIFDPVNPNELKYAKNSNLLGLPYWSNFHNPTFRIKVQL